jgi:hypothetical protein
MAAIDTLMQKIRRDLRDTGTSDGVDRTWSSAELEDLVNLALPEISRAYPRELVSTVAVPEILTSFQAISIALPAGMDSIIRIDSMKYRIDSTVSPIKEWFDINDTLDPANGWGPYSGWEIHGSTVYLQPGRIAPSTSHLRVVGYGDWTVDTLDVNAEQAVRFFVQAEAFFKLMADRTMFQQWQVNSGATDVSVPMIGQNYTIARQRFDRLMSRIRKIRRLG